MQIIHPYDWFQSFCFYDPSQDSIFHHRVPTFGNPFPPQSFLAGENQGLKKGLTDNEDTSKSCHQQYVHKYSKGYCGLPSVSTRGVELVFHVGYRRIAHPKEEGFNMPI